MINQLCFLGIGEWFKQLGNTIIYILIGLAVVVGIVIMAKNENSRKLIPYFLGLIFIFTGAFSGYSLYKDMKAESYVVGSIDITSQYSQEEFNYSSSSVVFYNDIYDETDTYSFEKELLKVDDFNGLKNDYELWLNDFILLSTEFNAGSIYSSATIDFYDEYSELLQSSTMNISIKFLSNKTQLTLSTSGSTNAQFLEQYFSDYGIRLKVIKIL